jgi:hypothetical protein
MYSQFMGMCAQSMELHDFFPFVLEWLNVDINLKC